MEISKRKTPYQQLVYCVSRYAEWKKADKLFCIPKKDIPAVSLLQQEQDPSLQAWGSYVLGGNGRKIQVSEDTIYVSPIPDFSISTDENAIFASAPVVFPHGILSEKRNMGVPLLKAYIANDGINYLLDGELRTIAKSRVLLTSDDTTCIYYCEDTGETSTKLGELKCTPDSTITKYYIDGGEVSEIPILKNKTVSLYTTRVEKLCLSGEHPVLSKYSPFVYEFDEELLDSILSEKRKIAGAPKATLKALMEGEADYLQGILDKYHDDIILGVAHGLVKEPTLTLEEAKLIIDGAAPSGPERKWRLQPTFTEPEMIYLANKCYADDWKNNDDTRYSRFGFPTLKYPVKTQSLRVLKLLFWEFQKRLFLENSDVRVRFQASEVTR